MTRQATDRSTASRHVDAHDRARRDYVKRAYGVDGDDPALYHLMLDSTRLGIDTCIDLVVAASESLTRGTPPRAASGSI